MSKLLFVADNHFGKHCGANLHNEIKDDYDIDFYEDDFSPLAKANDYDLLVLNMIADTCGLPVPDEAAQAGVKAYCEAGKDLLLLHGSSAAFWHCDWWRPIVGLRWVRKGDPDGVDASWHPVRPFDVTVSKSRHPLCAKLAPFKLPEDEIYISLEQTCPTMSLLETHTDEGIFPQAWTNSTPWGGTVIGFLPGHKPEVVNSAPLVNTTRILLDYLLNST